MRTVLVTGGGRGIGEDISRGFFDAGYRVAIVGRQDHGLAGELGERARFFTADVRSVEQIRGALEGVIGWSGRLDVVVNNAGFSEWRSLDQVDESFWDRMLDTNLKGVFFTCQAATPHLPRAGSIINISSLAGKRGSARNSVYCASKFGVNGLTQALAKELGARGIRVNAVCPVYVPTQGLLEALGDPVSPAEARNVEDYLAEFAATQAALRRLPTGREVADFCLYLASEAASAVTGQCINVDCGVLPQ